MMKILILDNGVNLLVGDVAPNQFNPAVINIEVHGVLESKNEIWNGKRNMTSYNSNRFVTLRRDTHDCCHGVHRRFAIG